VSAHVILYWPAVSGTRAARYVLPPGNVVSVTGT